MSLNFSFDCHTKHLNRQRAEFKNSKCREIPKKREILDSFFSKANLLRK